MNYNENIVKGNKRNVNIIVIVVFVLLLAGAFAVGFLIGKNQSNNEKEVTDNSQFEKTEDKKEDDTKTLETYTFNLFDVSKINKSASDNAELNNNIEVSNLFFNPKYDTYGKYKEVYIYGKNNNNQMVNLTITFEYYDKEGYRIEKQTGYAKVYGNTEFVISTYVLDDSYKYASVKLTYEAKKIKSYEKEIADKEFSKKEDKLNDGQILLTVKNNSTLEASFVSAACIYYKDGKVVFVQNSSTTSLKAGETAQIKFYDYKLKLNDDYKNPKKIEFDNYKIVMFSAYNSDSTNY